MMDRNRMNRESAKRRVHNSIVMLTKAIDFADRQPVYFYQKKLATIVDQLTDLKSQMEDKDIDFHLDP